MSEADSMRGGYLLRQGDLLRPAREMLPSGTQIERLDGGWTQDFRVEKHLSPSGGIPHRISFTTFFLAVVQSLPCEFEWKSEGRTKALRVGPDSRFTASPGFEVDRVLWSGEAQLCVINIGPEAMKRALPETLSRHPVELGPMVAADPDPVLSRLASAMEEEAAAGCPAGRLFMESLVSAVALYAAQQYSVRPIPETRRYGGLSRDRLSRVTDYIEAHLASDLSLAELAGVACLSPYHFGKMFQCSTGESVHRYVIRRRVERAKGLLRRGILGLAEIAETVGFSDQSHFTTIFKRHLHVTPSTYRRLIRC